MQVKRALDLTDLTLSYNHRFGQGDYGETFKFEAPLTFLISRITDAVSAHRSAATPVGPTGYTSKARRLPTPLYIARTVPSRRVGHPRVFGDYDSGWAMS